MLARLVVLGLLATGGLRAQDEGFTARRIAVVPDDLALESAPIPAPDGSASTAHARFEFGAGGRFVAYTAYRGAQSVAVIDERELGTFHYLHAPVLDPSGEHCAFRAGNRIADDRERWWAIVDGEAGKPFAWIGDVALAAEGAPVFWEQPGAKVQRDGAYNRSSMVLHFGTRTGKKFEDGLSLIMPAVSADGRTVATAGQRGGEWLPIVATARAEKADRRGVPSIDGIALSADGKRTAIVTTIGGMPLPLGVPPPPGVTAGRSVIMVDGKTWGDDFDGSGVPVFAPDGKRFAFKFLAGGSMGIAVDSDRKPAAGFEFVGTPRLSPDGKRLVFGSCAGGTVDVYARLSNWGDAAVRGGRWKLHGRVTKGGDLETIVDDAEALAHPTFAPSDGRLAYAQKVDGKWHIVVGETRSEAFDEVGPPQFGPDGTKVAFGARLDRELWWKVLDLD